MILLDTNVVSEPLRLSPSPRVLDWLDAHFAECAVSSISTFEMLAGVELMPAGRRRDALESAVTRLIRRFAGRVYTFDAAAAEAAARVLARARAIGLGLHQLPAKLADVQIAGIATAYGLELATRNVGDFRGVGLELIDPWAA